MRGRLALRTAGVLVERLARALRHVPYGSSRHTGPGAGAARHVPPRRYVGGTAPGDDVRGERATVTVHQAELHDDHRARYLPQDVPRLDPAAGLHADAVHPARGLHPRRSRAPAAHRGVAHALAAAAHRRDGPGRPLHDRRRARRRHRGPGPRLAGRPLTGSLPPVRPRRPRMDDGAGFAVPHRRVGPGSGVASGLLQDGGLCRARSAAAVNSCTENPHGVDAAKGCLVLHLPYSPRSAPLQPWFGQLYRNGNKG